MRIVCLSPMTLLLVIFLGAATPGAPNLLRVAEGVYSGGEPQGEEDFARLAWLGVKVVVSVDSARPDVQSARRHGLRYVHIPIGYDGVPREAGAAIARVAREVKGPVYFHCHHGRHRGPAAAAVACIAAGKADHRRALEILAEAGTSKSYAGLWRDVAAYTPPEPGAPLPELLEVAPVDSFAAWMSRLDRHYDHLTLLRDAGWRTPADHPDLVSAHELLLLKEALREAARQLPDRPKKDDLIRRFAAAEALTGALGAALAGENVATATRALEHIETSCRDCHERHRN